MNAHIGRICLILHVRKYTLDFSFCHFYVNYKIMNALECTQTNHGKCISKLVFTNPSVV